MTKKQILTLKMYRSIEKYITASSLLPNLKNEIFENFKAKIVSIESVSKELQNASIEIKKKLCKTGAEVELLLALNSKTSNLGYGIEPTFIIFYSALQRKTKDQLVKAMQQIHDEACRKINVLINSGITLPIMDYIQDMINDYSEGNSEGCVVRVKMRQLKSHFLEAEFLLKEIDKEAESFGKHNLDFFIAYSANRIPIASAKLRTRLKGSVLDEHEMPIEGAIVCIYGTNYETKTNTDGLYFLQNIPFGILKITASVFSHSDESSIVKIQRTKSNKVDFILQSIKNRDLRQRQIG